MGCENKDVAKEGTILRSHHRERWGMNERGLCKGADNDIATYGLWIISIPRSATRRVPGQVGRRCTGTVGAGGRHQKKISRITQ